MSNTTQHTSGPWRTGREDVQSYDGTTGQPFSSIYADDDRAGMHLGHKLPLRVATVHGDHINQHEERANARLISAAPDLYEAAKMLTAWVDSKSYAYAECARGWDSLRAAIAKAEGR